VSGASNARRPEALDELRLADLGLREQVHQLRQLESALAGRD
jgi:hypothetical protein